MVEMRKIKLDPLFDLRSISVVPLNLEPEYRNTISCDKTGEISVGAEKFVMHPDPLGIDSSSGLNLENGSLQYLKIYFDFAYYALVCPFRFKWDTATGMYNCHTNIIQKGLHYLVFGVMSICYLLRLRCMLISPVPLLSTIPKNSTKDHMQLESQNPTEFFDMAVYFFDSTFMIILFLHFGRRQNLVNSVFNELLRSRNMGKTFGNGRFQNMRFRSTLIMTISLMTVGLKLSEIFHDNDWNLTQLSYSQRQESQHIFISSKLVEAAPILFMFLNISSTLYQKILNDFGDILFTMCALLFSNLVQEFHISLGKGFEGSKEEVLRHYSWLKRGLCKLNRAMSWMMGAFIVGNLPFFATTVLEVFGVGTKNVFARLRYIIACAYFFPSICIAANANKKVEKIKDWITKEENYSKIPDVKLSVFLHDLNFHSIGINALGVLTVNWSSVGSIISIILTYALLKTQFKMDSVPDCNCRFVVQ